MKEVASKIHQKTRESVSILKLSGQEIAKYAPKFMAEAIKQRAEFSDGR